MHVPRIDNRRPHWCRHCRRRVLALLVRDPRDGLHVALTLMTCGVWFWVWLATVWPSL